jgi:hypothetical protein
MNYNYHIQVKNSRGKWVIIASFQNECDCGDCEAFLLAKYTDCKFRVVKDE